MVPSRLATHGVHVNEECGFSSQIKLLEKLLRPSWRAQYLKPKDERNE
jgi:hypothetical protein